MRTGKVSRPARCTARRRFLRDAAALIGAPWLAAPLAPAPSRALEAPPHRGPYAGKDARLRLVNDRPLCLETPAHLLDDPVTPAGRLFVRNNGTPPLEPVGERWRLTIDGEAAGRPVTFTLRELRERFEPVSLQLVLECAGNGRHEFHPPTPGNQWTTGAVGCPEWNGVRLRDVLEAAGVGPDAVYVAYHGADRHLSGDPRREPISRGVPVAKALEPESLLAWGMNGESLPVIHGFPLRLVFGGWPGSTSGKWVERLAIRDQVHDGAKMGGRHYRTPCRPAAPGEDPDDDELCIIEALPVKSLITSPQSGTLYKRTRPLPVRGHAWCGEAAVARVDVSTDYGQRWQQAELSPPVNRHAWQRFQTAVLLPTDGYYEIWARATDANGRSQPMVVPGWNPKGYLNNACHRVAVRAI